MTRLTRMVLPVALALSACVSGPTIKHVRPTLGALPTVEKVPVRLGIRYDETFSQAWQGHGGRSPIVPIGADSIAMLNEVAPLLAERVARVLPNAASPDDFVLEPSLDHFDFFDREEESSDWDSVAYRMSLFDPAGALVSSWTVEGRVPFVPGPVPPPAALPAPTPTSAPVQADEAASEPPMKDAFSHASENLAAAARRLVTGFRRDSRIEEYVSRRAAGKPLVLDGVVVEAALGDLPISIPGLSPSLYGVGLVPVKVRITNRSGAEVRITGLVARLALPDGRTLHAPSSRMVARRLETVSIHAANRKLGYGSIIGPIAVMAHMAEFRSVVPATRAMLASLALRAEVLPPQGTAEGHLYFLPHGPPELPSGPSTLSIWLTDAELRSLRVDVRIDLPSRVPKERAPAAPEPDNT